MNRFPDFGKELQRGFEVDERCFDCVELYHGCNARPENPSSRCADYFPLPDVGVNGQTGQEIPPSRMAGRKDPRVRLPNGAAVRAHAQTAKPPAGRPDPVEPKPEDIEQDPGDDQDEQDDRPPGQPRQQSPAATRGLDGTRRCSCGALLKKLERCCPTCRAKRRKEALERYEHQRKARNGHPDDARRAI